MISSTKRYSVISTAGRDLIPRIARPQHSGVNLNAAPVFPGHEIFPFGRNDNMDQEPTRLRIKNQLVCLYIALASFYSFCWAQRRYPKTKLQPRSNPSVPQCLCGQIHSVIFRQNRLIEEAFPVSSSTSISTAFNLTSPSAGSNRAGI
jgi:hypothetical protein